MNAPALAIRPAFDLSAAHTEAHGWTKVAAPLIKAYLALDQVQGDLVAAGHEAAHAYEFDIRYGVRRIADAMSLLRDDIDGVRDSVIADLSPPSPNRGVRVPGDHMVWDDYDDLCDMWTERCRDVLSVEGAIAVEARS